MSVLSDQCFKYEKLTLLMKTLSTHSQSLSEVPNITKKFNELSTKFDNINKRLDDLHDKQSETKDQVDKLTSDLTKNSKTIKELKSKVEKLKDETIANSQALSGKIAAITSQILMTSSTVVQQTLELIISGVPEPVATELSPSDIADKVFEVLNITNLKQDILSIRKIDKKSNSTSSDRNANINNDRNKPISYSYVLKLKSPQIRDFIIESRRKLKILPIKKVFSTIVGDSYRASLDEFAPLRIRKVTKSPNPWLTKKLKNKCFRKHHGTQSALLKLINDINSSSSSMDTGKLTLLVLFDLTKAFDYVNPRVILSTLIELGFSVKTISWFFSYLTNRSQAVLNDDGLPTEFLKTTSGVPQGSVLGPILFLLVMNSVAKRLIYSRHGLFADDKYIYLHFHYYQLYDAIRQITTDAQAVADWAKNNGLEINVTKTKAMLLGSSGKLKNIQHNFLPPIVVNGIAIPFTESAKCLGLHITNTLSWNLHTSKTISKINSALYSLKLRKSIYTTDIKRLLVSAILTSYLLSIIVLYC
ncbi:uncharacterized protein LOC123265327 [Cotesia glomerata]|uniref:uncharacterized protein LOC123265327 n=1 Tax=Cotesia glomerata TaxID=32391 RepID=UPI001D014795|nr:uncharacterized protein LOC123265327 [Cotesia glomerata]